VNIAIETHEAKVHTLPLTRSLRRLCAIVMAASAGGAVDAVATVFFPDTVLQVPLWILFLGNGVAVVVTWLVAWCLLTRERCKPFGTTFWRYLWIVLYYGTGMIFMLRFALAISNNLHDFVWQAARNTRFESLTTGLRISVEIASVVILIGALMALPRLLARIQLRGVITARAADDCLWFAAITWAFGALEAWTVGVSWQPDQFFRPINYMFVVTGFVLTRIALSRPRLEHAPSLVIVLLEGQHSSALRHFIARFSGLWGLGQITLVAAASNAIDYYGSHARVAARAGCLKTLFPRTEFDLIRARNERPRDAAWKALAIRECYPALPMWTDCLRSLITPSTWVLLVAESHDLVTAADASKRLDAVRALLPLSRTFAITGEHVPVTLRGLRIVRLAALGRDSAKHAADTLQRHIYYRQDDIVRPDPDWPAAYLWAPLAWNGLGVCALFAIGALVNRGFGHRATMTMIFAVLVALNHCIAAAVAILPKRYLRFARRYFWHVRPKGAYLLSGLMTFVILLGISAVTYLLRLRYSNGPIPPFLAQTKWLLLSVTLTVTLAWMCDDYGLESKDPRWLRPAESIVLALLIALVSWLVVRSVAQDFARIRPGATWSPWTPVLVSAGIGALFGFTWPSWYRRNLRARTGHTMREDLAHPPLRRSSEPPTVV